MLRIGAWLCLIVNTASSAAAAAHWQPCAMIDSEKVVHIGLSEAGMVLCSSSDAAAWLYGPC